MPQIDMELIREAMQRRMQGQGTPAADQQTIPMGTTPAGQPNTPTTPPQAAAAGVEGGSSLPPRKDVNAALKAGQQANSPQFDDETRLTAKALVAKLLKVL